MTGPELSILIIEDERAWAQFLEEFLCGLGYHCATALNGEDGIAAYRESPTDVVLVDWRLPDLDGMDVIRTLRMESPHVVLIMMTGHGTSESALQAYESGANDYLTKPFNANQVHMTIGRVLEYRRLEEENERLRRVIENRSCFDRLVGGSPSMQALYRLIEQVAPSETPVLITGEHGAGKSVVAESIHSVSRRPRALYESLDCASLGRDQFDTALFGVEGSQGGFAAIGAFERAGEGTICLENVDALPPTVQDRLLSALQAGEFRHVGSSQPVTLRARVISTASPTLTGLVESGEFRRDLFYRLGVVTTQVPPLRERREDIPLLANFLLERHNRRLEKQVDKISFETMLVLSSYSWPDNVLELDQTIERLVADNTDGVIRASSLPAHMQRDAAASGGGVTSANVPLKEAKKRFEREYFRDLLRRAKGNMSLASRSSRVGRPYLYKKINDYDIDPNEFR